MNNKYIVWGSINAFLAVLLGAFGAHGLKELLSETMLKTYETGVHYHLIHALGLILIGILADKLPSSAKIKWSARMLLTGIVLFSGSLYVLSISGVKILGAITPFGGVAFLTGWLLLTTAAWKK